jgi:hypothetical protein
MASGRFVSSYVSLLRDGSSNAFVAENHKRNGSYPWFSNMKASGRPFVSINSMRAGYTNREASLNRFNGLTLCPWLNANAVVGFKRGTYLLGL